MAQNPSHPGPLNLTACLHVWYWGAQGRCRMWASSLGSLNGKGSTGSEALPSPNREKRFLQLVVPALPQPPD